MAEERVHEVVSPLPPINGEPAFLLRAMKAEEKISSPFKFTLDLFSVDFNIDPTDLLGESMTVVLNIHERKRYFNGLVSRFLFLGRTGNYAHYRAELRPWFWFLSHTANCRIFQEMNTTDIFDEVAKTTHGFADYDMNLTGSYVEREYCVQYRESDFAFLSRLLEEEGIFYYCEHHEDKHILVLGDSTTAYGQINARDGDKIPYRPPGEAQVDLEHIYKWAVDHQVCSTNYVHDDFDFTKPSVDLEGAGAISRDHANADFEVYDYPGRYSEVGDGNTYANVRIEELQSSYKRLNGAADHRDFKVGHSFSLVEYPREAENAEYVLLEAKIEVESAEVEQFRQGADNVFDVEFVAYPKNEPFRPPRRTRKPIVQGPQTAIVVGKSGEEIWTDEYGRVKCQFHWDREGQSDENSSCWVRVSQHWAGKTWGGIHIPRIGQEVIVDFLEGDPDRPIITGRVYNDEQMPPYELPANQTQSGTKSRSTKDGTTETFNELRFEDKKDDEEIYFHAEKDFTRIVENDDVLKIGFEKMDPGDQTVEIYNDQSITVGQNRTAEIQQGNDSTTVSLGDHSIGVDAGKSTIEAAQKITLKVGTSSITIEPAKITISSVQIDINGSATTKVAASGMTEVKGGLVKIN